MRRDAPYGNLNPCRPRNVQIILACLDVDRLADFIRPWLPTIDWPRALKIEKQYGNRFDLQAEKVREQIK